MSLYLTILYIVLFTFFVAFPYVFQDVYGISQGLTNLIWLSVFVGFWPLGLTLYFVWKWTLKDIAAQSKATGTVITAPRAETRLLFAMAGGAVSPHIRLRSEQCKLTSSSSLPSQSLSSGWAGQTMHLFRSGRLLSQLLSSGTALSHFSFRYTCISS